MSVPARGLARHLVIAGLVTAGLSGGGAAALAAPAPAPAAGQVIPAECGDSVTASPGDEVHVTSRTGKLYVIPVTAQSPASKSWNAGLLCTVTVNAVQRPVAAPAPAAVVPPAPVAPAAGTAATGRALAPTAPVAPVAPVPGAGAAQRSALASAPAPAPAFGQSPLLGSALAPAGAPAPAPAPVLTDPATMVDRTSSTSPDTGDGPSSAPLVLGALAAGALIAGGLRYRLLHRRMSSAAAPGAGPAAPGSALRHVAPAAPEADDVTRVVAPPAGPALDETTVMSPVESSEDVTALVERVPAGRF